jgi:hypothetical protein
MQLNAYIFQRTILNIERFHIGFILFGTLVVLMGLIQLPISGGMLTSVVAQSSSSPSAVMEVAAHRLKQNEYYIFTQELNANESKLGVSVAYFTLTDIIVHKGDTVTIHFYNTADEPGDRHTFTVQPPYKMDHDLAGGQNTTFSFNADTVGGLLTSVDMIFQV